jgi:hypothetical protein
MSKDDDEKEAGKDINISISGDVSGQLGAGDNVVQIGSVSGGKVVFGPEGTDAGNDEPEARTRLEREQLADLRQTLSLRFSESELRDLVFDLGLDYDNLPGDNKAGKARELVAYCDRHGLIDELDETIQRSRPDIFE